MSDEKIFNPLDKRNLGESVKEALLESPIHPIPITKSFEGAGIYALYYLGKFRPYKKIAEKNSKRLNQPIYIGKAVPRGARKGKFDLDQPPGKPLYSRINQHAKSIAQANNLNTKDFRCRYLVVDDIWIPLGETLLIQKFNPLWNVVVEGFGIHDPGKGRREQQISNWEVLHPGRSWTAKQKPSEKTQEEILKKIENFLKK